MSEYDVRHEIALDDKRCPACIRQMPSPPKTLYVRGDPEALQGPCAAVIGSRRATPYGIATAEIIAVALAQAGITVVSGGARGCDQAAGRATLKAGGRHVVVLGTGADTVYPRSAATLIRGTIEAGGAVVSIERWGTGPRKFAFPKRNRIIAALSRALFITEADLPSGTFSTAEAAVALDREVFAVPGSIMSPLSRGTNHLIASGAGCIIDEDSIEMAISRIFGTLRYCRSKSPVENGDTGTEQEIMRALFASPLRIDEIAAMLSLGVMDCLPIVSSLEMRKRVERLPDGRFTPTARSVKERSIIIDSAP